MVFSRYADRTDEPAKPISGNDVAFGILWHFSKNSGKAWCNRDAVAGFSFAGASVAQDFRGN
jgi:hypothetical protein